MFIKEKIADRIYDKILGIYPKEKTKKVCRFNGIKCHTISLSKHKSKGGRLLALFCRIKFRK